MGWYQLPSRHAPYACVYAWEREMGIAMMGVVRFQIGEDIGQGGKGGEVEEFRQRYDWRARW